MISTCVFVGFVWIRVASMDASLRIFSLWTTRALCPTLRRLGTLVLQAPFCAGVGVAASGTVVGGSVAAEAGVGVKDSVVAASVAAEVGVDEGTTVVGVVVGPTVDGIRVSVESDAGRVGVETGGEGRFSVAFGEAIVSAGARETTFAAHPRRSMRRRIARRITVTIVLNRS